MIPKSFPKRLDSKTSCLRITVPENLDLALEGLIRKVLREQPKTDDIYSFAANYFETLLRIRDKAGVEYTATQLCPFHNDEEAREMIVLAGTFPRQVPGRVQGKGLSKTETKKKTDKVEAEKVKKSEETLKDSEVETKQATPDLIKKLPAQKHGLNEEETTEPNHDRTETIKEGGDEEEYQTSDPIKEFVEKELMTERNSKEKMAQEKASESGSSGKNEEAEGGATLVGNADEKKGADEGDNPGATDVVIGVIQEGEDEGKQKIEPGTRETDEKEVEVREADGKIVCEAQPEAKEEQALQEKQQKKENENEEWTIKPGTEEESENKMESEAEGVEAPLPPLPISPVHEEEHEQEVVHEVSHSYTETDVLEGREATQTASSSVAATPKEEGIVEVGEVQKSPESKDETDAQQSTASPTKIDEESPNTSSLVTNNSKPAENGTMETDKSQNSDMKEANGATEPVALGEEEVQDPTTEAASRRTERSTNGSETGSLSERDEGDASFQEKDLQEKKGEESNEEKENPDTRAEEPREGDHKSTEEEEKLTSAEAEHVGGEPQAEAVDEGTDSSGIFDSGINAGGSEILKHEKFSSSDKVSESKDPEGKEDGDKKLSAEEAKAEEESLAERRESPDNRTSPEEVPLQVAEDVQSAAEAPKEESMDAKQEDSREGSDPTDGALRLTEPGKTAEITGSETESAEPQEFKTEDALPAEKELATEELCSVVDINYLKKDGGDQEEPEPAKLRAENTPEEKSEPESSLPPSAPNGETGKENGNDTPNFQRESEAEDATREKAESEEPPKATPVQIPAKSETDGDSSEGTGPVTLEGFDPSAQGKQIIIVEEPETTSENPEESSLPGEIQIKTIQTHYYDALRVPEMVTREYRMHEVIAPTIVGHLGASTPPASTPEETRESPADEERSGRPTDDNVVPATSDGPSPSPHSGAESLLAVDGSDRDAQASLPRPGTPTSDVSSDFSELSSRAASETFLTNEKRFSSLEKEEIRFVTPATEEAGTGEPEGRAADGSEGVLPFTEEDGLESQASGGEIPEGKEVTEHGKHPSGSPSGTEPEHAEDVQRPTENTQEGVPESHQEDVRAENRCDAPPLDHPSTERTTTGEASHPEADSPTTEAKRSDSARRDLASARSLDLGKRNPLLRTRSLSAHRHGVADFEVWSTIEKELEEAATKIQSKFRGYKTRKKLRREIAVQISTEDSSERSTSVEADDADNHPRATGEFHDGIVLAEHPR